MLTSAELTGMREASEAAMPDQGTIVRPTGTGTINPVTGVFTPGAATALYAGVMRVRQPTANELERLFGDTQVTVQRYVGTIPYSVDGVTVDDILTVTESTDPSIVGVGMRVTAPSYGSNHIDRRLALEVVE